MFCLSYFPPIEYYFRWINHLPILEWEEHFQKQSYRNRFCIFGANGKLCLSIPIIHTGDNNQKIRDVKISYDHLWQSHHWNSIYSAYRSSPYFEFYEEEIKLIFEKKEQFLVDLNIKIHEVISNILEIKPFYEKTNTYKSQIDSDTVDFRKIHPKIKSELTFPPYTQVFSDKHGFLANLSILDLIFSEGPNASQYLELLLTENSF
ncbi:hypothetical protein JBKA6_0277 [Ichthyobacterium seriolicida]|uniref:WbqC-like protein n=1 Tax=Ichthyobacterium seriolicida TaxID=242600 RepID=A0A1J1DWQ6_9FLAO|nr:hypothetical protein JBKA6_0277 [Ichthyobacterium seriolicida]